MGLSRCQTCPAQQSETRLHPRPRQSSERARILPSTYLPCLFPSFAFPSRSPSLFPFPFSFISPSSALPSFFSFSLHHLPTLPPPPHHPHFVPSPSPIVYAPLVFPRSGSTSPSSSNRTAGQCATYSDHVQPTCPTRPCSSSKYHTGAERAVYRSRNSLIQHHLYRSAIRERTELFVPLPLVST